MSQVSWKIGSATSALAIASWLNMATTTLAQTTLEELIQHPSTSSSASLAVNQLRDISPTDWAYEALSSLSERYGCITGFPNLTYRGSQTLSRYEFAVGLNFCLQQIEHLTISSEAILREDIDTIKRLIEEFETETATFGGGIEKLVNRTDFLQDNQFSPTTKLAGEVILGLASVLAGSKENGTENIDRVPVLGDNITLELETSFTGEDALSIELEAVNFPSFVDETGTFQGDLAFGGSNDNKLDLDLLTYTFPVGDNLEVIVSAAGAAADDIAETINFLEGDNGGNGAISNFGGLNPIYETAEDTGLGFIFSRGTDRSRYARCLELGDNPSFSRSRSRR